MELFAWVAGANVVLSLVLAYGVQRVKQAERDRVCPCGKSGRQRKGDA